MATASDQRLRATARSVHGSLRHEVTIGSGRHVIYTDEPEGLGGDDTGPAPHELLPAALASCIATTIAMYTRTRDWDVGDVQVDVDYDHRATPRRFTIAIRVDRELTPEQLSRLEKVAESCPVRRAIEGGIAFDEHFVRG